MSKNILVLASNFPPYDGGRIGSSIRVYTMADFLARSGYKIHIAIPARYHKDRDSPVLHGNIQVHKYFSLFQYFDHSKNIGIPLLFIRKAISFLKIIIRKVVIDPNRIFSFLIVLYLKRIVKKNRISIAISSSPPLVVSDYALKLKKKFGDDLLWIMDLRDISSLHPSIKARNDKFASKMEKSEAELIEFSDVSFVVSIGMKKHAERILTKYIMQTGKNKIHIIENGFVDIIPVEPQPEIVEFYQKAREEGRIIIVYAGTGVLNTKEIASSKNKTLNNLVDIMVSDPVLSSKYALIIQGVVKNSENYFNEIETKLMHLKLPPISNEQMRANLKYADIGVNINIDKDYSPLIMGGKIYDYCVSGIALLLVFPKNADSLKDFAEKHTNKPYFADVFNKESIRNILNEIVEYPDKLIGNKFTADEMEPHSRENQYKKILEIFGEYRK